MDVTTVPTNLTLIQLGNSLHGKLVPPIALFNTDRRTIANILDFSCLIKP